MAINVYHEKQEASLCGVHCLNSLLQGPYFTEIDLAQIAHEFDKKEKEVMAEMGTETTDFLKFMAEDSGNVADDGNYSIQVLSTALKVWNFTCIPITNPEVKDVLKNPTAEKAYICNLAAHWITLLKISNNWWDLNSVNKEPRWISDLYLGLYIETLKQSGYSIFIVRGEFPKSNVLATSGGMGKWHKMYSKNQQIHETRQTDEELEAAIAASLEAQMEEAMKLSLLTQTTITTQSEKNIPSVDNTMSEEELLLQEALELSKQDAPAPKKQKNEEIKREPPVEPNAGDPNSRQIAFRLLDGSRKARRFNKTDTLDDIFAYLYSIGVDKKCILVYSPPRKEYRGGKETIEELGFNSIMLNIVKE